MDTIADFLVSDSTPFTTKLLQGVPIKAVYSFDEHRKQGNEEQKEALNVLEIIWTGKWYLSRMMTTMMEYIIPVSQLVNY